MTTEALKTKSATSWWFRLGTLLIGAYAIWIGLGFLSNAIFGPEYTYAGHALRAAGTFALVALLLTLVLKWEGATAQRYGLLPDRRTPLNVGLGAFGYFLPFIVTAVVILSLGLATLTITGTPGEVIGQLAAVLVLVLLYEAIPEELIFRGYFFTLLKERFPTWAAIIGQAVLFCLFGFAIGAAQTPDRLLLFLVLSMFLGVVRAATGSVFATIGFHAAFQTITQPLLGAQWTAITLDDPERWFSDLALALSPLVLGPVIVILLAKLWQRKCTMGHI